nr:hypothetical protein CFP56_74358 [Quercus suber]
MKVKVNLNNHATHVEGSMICEHASHVVTEPHFLESHATHVEGSIISEHASHVVTRLALGPYRDGMEYESETITKVGLKREWAESGVEIKVATHGKEKKTRLDVGFPYPTSTTVEPPRSQ